MVTVSVTKHKLAVCCHSKSKVILGICLTLNYYDLKAFFGVSRLLLIISKPYLAQSAFALRWLETVRPWVDILAVNRFKNGQNIAN